MPVSPADLRAVPLFASITDDHLGDLLKAFERRSYAASAVLFEEGSRADRLLVLVSGEVVVWQGAEELFRLRPIAPIGELGALAGLRRTTSAIAADACEVLTIDSEALLRFFETHGDVAYPFHHNLLRVVADKIERDRRRMEEMRENIISTQKAMKRMREALLEDDDTPLHTTLFEELDAHIEQNRKGHYLVQVPRALPAKVRLDDGAMRDVLALSNELLHLASGAAGEKGDAWSGVLVTRDVEIPVSGTIERGENDRVVVCLDMLIEEYEKKLERELAKMSLLDVVL
jgi:CRP-like cAMP-binding protein